jgi:hypothetical protein
MIACWPLDEVAIAPPEAAADEAPAGEARMSTVLERYGSSGRPEEHVEVTCGREDAKRLFRSIGEMHELVDSLRRRQGRAPRTQLAALDDDALETTESL